MPRSLLSIDDLSKSDILGIFKKADQLRRGASRPKASKICGLLFFEASTRTRIGFEAAAYRLSMSCILATETKINDQMTKAESIPDTIRTLDPYLDCFCIRHPDEKILDQVTPYTKKPIINCGNGYDEHPTQALIDAYTIWRKLGKLDRLNITIIGEVKYARSVHSLVKLLANFSGNTINELTPTTLRLQSKYLSEYKKRNSYRSPANHEWVQEQVVYSAGFPPKNPSGSFSQKLRDKYKITTPLAKRLSSDCVILNPLPRIDEIDTAVDKLPQAYYFTQNENGLPVRMAILEFCLGA